MSTWGSSLTIPISCHQEAREQRDQWVTLLSFQRFSLPPRLCLTVPPVPCFSQCFPLSFVTLSVVQPCASCPRPCVVSEFPCKSFSSFYLPLWVCILDPELYVLSSTQKRHKWRPTLGSDCVSGRWAPWAPLLFFSRWIIFRAQLRLSTASM